VKEIPRVKGDGKAKKDGRGGPENERVACAREKFHSGLLRLNLPCSADKRERNCQGAIKGKESGLRKKYFKPARSTIRKTGRNQIREDEEISRETTGEDKRGKGSRANVNYAQYKVRLRDRKKDSQGGKIEGMKEYRKQGLR